MRGEWRRLRLRSGGGFWFSAPGHCFGAGEKAGGDDNLLFSSVSPDCGGGGGMDAALRSRKYANFSFKTYPFLK